MEQPSILTVFEETCSGLEIDSRLAKRIIQYQLWFVNKNDDHVKFFGGHLTGVEVVRFSQADRNGWFEEILGVIEEDLAPKLEKLPYVNNDHVVASDTMNISCAWLIYAMFNSPKIPDKLKHEAIISTLLVLQYKFLTSRLYRHFKYVAEKATAEATYASLSRKFALKQHGNWGATLRARAEDIVSPTGIHSHTLKNAKDFLRITTSSGYIYFLNDTQTRLRDMLKNIFNVHLEVSHAGTKISTLSSIIEHDGKEILRDRTKSLAAYTRYINAIVTDKSSFVREELLTVIENLIHTMPPTMFRKTLDFISDNYRSAKLTEIEEVLQETLVHSFSYLAQNRQLAQNSSDLAGMMVRLKGVYTAARSTDPILFNLRDKMEAIVKQATGTKNPTVLSPVRTGVLLYIVLRALTMNHYTNSV